MNTYKQSVCWRLILINATDNMIIQSPLIHLASENVRENTDDKC